MQTTNMHLCEQPQVHRDDASASMVMSAPQVFAAHACPLTAAAFSPSAKRLVTCDSAGVILLWSNLAAPPEDAWAGSAAVAEVGAARRKCNPFDAAIQDDGSAFGGGGDSGLTDGRAEGGEDELMALMRTTAAGLGRNNDDEEEKSEKERYLEELAAAEFRRESSDDLISGLVLGEDRGVGEERTGRVEGDFPRMGSPSSRGMREETVRREYAAMLAQTPPPQTTGSSSRTAVRRSTGKGRQVEHCGSRAEALASLQIAMAQVAAAVGEEGGSETPAESGALRESRRLAEAATKAGDRPDTGKHSDDAKEARNWTPKSPVTLTNPLVRTVQAAVALAPGFGYSDSSSSSSARSSSGSSCSYGGHGSCVVDGGPVGPERDLRDPTGSIPAVRGKDPAASGERRIRQPVTGASGGRAATSGATSTTAITSIGAAIAAALPPSEGQAEDIEESGVSSVRWHPASGTLIYRQGRALFAEDLESCHRRCLSSSLEAYETAATTADPRVGEGRKSESGGQLPADSVDEIIAVSPGGSLIARGARRIGRGSLSILSLECGQEEGRGGVEEELRKKGGNDAGQWR